MSKVFIKQAVVSALVALFAGSAVADDQAIAELEQKVNAKVQQLESVGLLPSYQEIEMIKVDLIDEEIRTTGVSAAELVEKYQLGSALERSVKIKEAIWVQTISGGQVVLPPKDPPQGGK